MIKILFLFTLNVIFISQVFSYSLQRAFSYKLGGSQDRALDEYYGWLSENYTNGVEYDTLIEMTDFDSNYKRSIDILEKYSSYIKDIEKRCKALNYLGSLYEDNLYYENAKQSYYTAYILSNSTDYESYYKFAYMLYHIGNYDDVVDVLEEIIKNKNSTVFRQTILLYSKVLFLKNNIKDGVNIVIKSIKDYDKYPDLLYNLAVNIIDYTGDYENEYLKKIESNFKDSIYNKLLVDYFKSGNEKRYKTMIEPNTFMFEYINNLNYSNSVIDIVE